jgi:tRNA(Leu) C34 or U34 (ribose-2'-O)-methylase TrmL
LAKFPPSATNFDCQRWFPAQFPPHLGRRRGAHFGNEKASLPSDVEDACDETRAHPMTGRAESLNLAIAAGVLIYEAWRTQGYGRGSR